jgi:DNA processing protein
MKYARVLLTPLDPRYPSRLRALAKPPASLIVQGGSLEAERIVAVVGARAAGSAPCDFARDLAKELARRGVVVVSGGALGIDGAAHQATLDAKGRTWVVAGTDPAHCFPPEHARLFARVARGPGAMIWPFEREVRRGIGFPHRNRILIALADAVVVVQAGPRSGALSAARWARRLGKPLWVPPVPPWSNKGFEGSNELLAGGARPLTSSQAFLASVAPESRARTQSETAVLGAICGVPLHVDAIAAHAHQPPHAATAALLTLALENVVVEGPSGFFRRRDAPNQ